MDPKSLCIIYSLVLQFFLITVMSSWLLKQFIHSTNLIFTKNYKKKIFSEGMQKKRARWWVGILALGVVFIVKMIGMGVVY